MLSPWVLEQMTAGVPAPVSAGLSRSSSALGSGALLADRQRAAEHGEQ